MYIIQLLYIITLTIKRKSIQMNQINIKFHKQEDEHYKEYFDHARGQRSAVEFFKLIFNNYLASEKGFTIAEESLIEQSINILNTTRESFQQMAVLQYAKKICQQQKNKINTPKKSAVADKHANELLDKMMETNNKTEKQWYEKVYINPLTLSKFSKNSINIEVIKRCLILNRLRINEHHKKHDMNEDHNRKCANYLKNNKKTLIVVSEITNC